MPVTLPKVMVCLKNVRINNNEGIKDVVILVDSVTGYKFCPPLSFCWVFVNVIFSCE
jgi:hypothetical protein